MTAAPLLPIVQKSRFSDLKRGLHGPPMHPRAPGPVSQALPRLSRLCVQTISALSLAHSKVGSPACSWKMGPLQEMQLLLPAFSPLHSLANAAIPFPATGPAKGVPSLRMRQRCQASNLEKDWEGGSDSFFSFLLTLWPANKLGPWRNPSAVMQTHSTPSDGKGGMLSKGSAVLV